MVHIATGLLLILALTSSRSAADEPPPLDTAALDRFLQEQAHAEHIPGLALVVVRADRVVYLALQGLRDRERHLPVTADTVFPIGSCTKAFTSMAVAIAQDQGRLILDDHPRRTLPWFRMADPEADAGVTLRDMLCHRTGLRAYADLAAEPGVLTREQYVRAAAAARPSARFRAAFQYSNVMYSAVGDVLGRVYGSSWERVIERQIFAPLGMSSSLTTARDAVRLADHVTGYVFEPATNSWRAVAVPQSLKALAPGGNVAASIRDLTQWLRLLTGGGLIGDQRLVSEKSFREITAPHMTIRPGLSYALGWATYDLGGLRVVEHNGGSQGLSALVSFIPERRVGFAFVANTSPNSITKVGNAAHRLWPLILGRPAETPSSPPPSTGASPALPAPPKAEAPGPTPTVDELLARMMKAIGGEAVLRRHTSLEIRARKWYANHGVRATLRVRAESPNRRSEEETWRAAGREIARLRVYFDGRHGGQETTFGQDAVNDAAADEHAARANHLHPLLHLRDLYTDLRVPGRGAVGTEPVWILELKSRGGPPVLWRVAESSALVLERESEGETVSFADYRQVDGQRIPFRTTIHDALGETIVEVDRARFGAHFGEGMFRPGGALH